MNLGELFKLQNGGVSLDSAFETEEQEEKKKSHRVTHEITRPTEEVILKCIAEENDLSMRSEVGCTDECIKITMTHFNIEWYEKITTGGYLITQKQTKQMYWVPDEKSLNMNFIYRLDLDIEKFESKDEVLKVIKDRVMNSDRSMPSEVCYILDNPVTETYEVYWESNYPLVTYGQSTPRGCFIHRYSNRFLRDIAILKLDKMYSDSSEDKAKKLTKRAMKDNEAIIVSDGCWMNNVCSASWWYLDNFCMRKGTTAIIPSDANQSVLIGEITGAYEAISECIRQKKTKITYYYDNTSIVNIFRNRKMEYLTEIKQYKDMLETAHKKGYEIEFVELHPKTEDDMRNDNKALSYFHNICDRECREISEIYKKDYKKYTVLGDKSESTTFSDIKVSIKPKGRPRR